MFKKRIRCVSIVLISILSLSVVFAVLLGVTLRHNKGSEELTVLAGDASFAEGVEISLFEQDESSFHWSNYPADLCQCSTDYQNTYRIRFDGTKASMNVSCGTIDKEFGTYSHRYYFDTLGNGFGEEEGYREINGSEFPGQLFVYMYNRYSSLFGYRYSKDDYITFGEEDKFLYYYNKDSRRSYEGFSFPVKDNSETEKSICYLNGKAYVYCFREPTYEYYCTYNKYSDQGGASASVETQQWNFEEACENVPDTWYVSKLKEFGMPEITMHVKKGIYCIAEDSTLTYVLPMNDTEKEFDFLWMASVEEENALSVIGRTGDMLVEFRYYVETGTVTEHVLWDAGDELTDWFEAVEGVTNIDIMEEGGRTYLCYSKQFYEPAEEEYSYAEGNLVRLVVFEQGNRVFEGEIRLQKESDDVLQDFSLNTNEEHDRYQRMCGIEIRKK